MKRRSSTSKIGTNQTKSNKKPRTSEKLPSTLQEQDQIEIDLNLNPEALVEKYVELENENERTPEIMHSPARALISTNTIRPHSPSRPLSPMRPQSPIRERGFFARSILIPELEATEASKVCVYFIRRFISYF